MYAFPGQYMPRFGVHYCVICCVVETKFNVISSVLIGTLYLAPGTQHCLQEKSTSFLLLTEHLKLCHREYPHRYHTLNDN